MVEQLRAHRLVPVPAPPHQRLEWSEGLKREVRPWTTP
ncbi:MAG: hypothetical protein AVDCRST_MAG06-361 [uncultured Nocardioides sp.]|uniref:Uncharacterized protein n=1 Tax=uncultured Nocardioides sp. TaxID=198441 RepID=A0A6J4N0P4_9ACTN|nr:MAG: hypothetical protein AVDCRST_MAG06-361 [uncultured Nocardioides sp.]